MTISTLQAVNLDGTWLTGIKGQGLERREKHLIEGNSGTLHQTFHCVRRGAPKASFSTVAVGALLALLSTSTDAPMKNIATALDLVYAAQEPTKPGYATTGHLCDRIAKGHVYLSGLAWSKTGDGLEASVDAFGLSADGTTNPVAAATPTLPTDEPTEVYALTSATLGGQAISQAESVTIAIDHRGENNIESICHSLDLPFPVLMATAGVNGQVAVEATLECNDLAVAPSATGTLVLVFTKFAFGGTIGTGTITVTINAGMIREESKAAQHGSPATRRFKIMASFDGTNLPLTVVVA